MINQQYLYVTYVSGYSRIEKYSGVIAVPIDFTYEQIEDYVAEDAADYINSQFPKAMINECDIEATNHYFDSYDWHWRFASSEEIKKFKEID